MNKLTFLGTGTCQIQKNRMASSVLLELGKVKIVYDMGRGVVQRLLDMGLKQDDIQHIIISHFHTDHISDIPSFIHAGLWSKIDPRTETLNIYGPPGIEHLVENIIIDGMVSSFRLVDRFKIKTKEIKSNTLSIKGQKFSVKILQPANNHAIKFKISDKMIAITGDFEFPEEAIEFLEGTDITIVDAGHNSIDELVELAARTNPAVIYCTHLYDKLSEVGINKRAKKRGYKGKIIVAKDLMEIKLD